MDAKAEQTYLNQHLSRIAVYLERHARERDGTLSDGAIPEKAVKAEIVENTPLDILCNIFGLTDFERDTLLLAAGVELHTDIAGLVALLQGGDGKSVVPASFSLALSALDGANWSALLPTSPLRYWNLLRLDTGQGVTSSHMRIDERILHFLTGHNYLDKRLSDIIKPAHLGAGLVSSQVALADHMASVWRNQTQNSEQHAVFQLCGADAHLNIEIAQICAAHFDSGLMVIRARDLPVPAAELGTLQRLWERESLLGSGLLLLILCDDVPDPASDLGKSLSSFVESANSPLMISTPARLKPFQRVVLTHEIKKPLIREQVEIWRQGLSAHTELASLDYDPSPLAYQFDLGPMKIEAAIIDAAGVFLSETAKNRTPETLGEKIWEACRYQSRLSLDDVVKRIDGGASWDDLILPKRARDTLQQMVEQVQHRSQVYGDWRFAEQSSRGLGIAALFTGPSGTGKTLAAEAVANRLSLDLYRIDLSAVIDKYIGETEKNLRRVFDAAEAGGAVLLFDEADALFSTRGDVNNSNDRFANMEVGYLLQRIEAYRGLAILTTNLKDNIDQAFLRRLRFIVPFPFPGTRTRSKIWQSMFPGSTPVKDLDYSKLSQLDLTGGSIRNIALNAAFLAAEAKSEVTMNLILAAAREEFAKLQKPLTQAELEGWE